MAWDDDQIDSALEGMDSYRPRQGPANDNEEQQQVYSEDVLRVIEAVSTTWHNSLSGTAVASTFHQVINYQVWYVFLRHGRAVQQ